MYIQPTGQVEFGDSTTDQNRRTEKGKEMSTSVKSSYGTPSKGLVCSLHNCSSLL